MTDLKSRIFPKFVRAMGFGVWGGENPAPPVICLSESVCELILDLMGRTDVEDLRPLAPHPFTHGFVEWHHTDVSPDAPIAAVCAQKAEDGTPPEIWFWKHNLGMLGAGRWDERGLSVDRSHPHWRALIEEPGLNRDRPWSEAADSVIGHWDRLWVTTCAVLAAPGVRTVDEQQREKRLQVRKGQPAPLITYRCVDINIDQLAGIPEQVSGGHGAANAGVALHHVRGHLRLTEKKGLVPVRAHWRGDPRYGTRLRDHNIMRDEEISH